MLEVIWELWEIGQMKLLEFIFGKKPEIVFTDDGRTRHNHKDQKWQDWKQRFSSNPEYDWKRHVGTNAGKDSLKKKG